MHDEQKWKTLTPPEGTRHEVPTDAIEVYEAVWLRITMAGIQLARGARLTRRLSWAITTITAVTSLTIFVTLSLSTGTVARAAVGAVTAMAAILAAWESKASEEARLDAKALSDMLHHFLPLRRELAHALSDCRMNGAPIDAELLARAEKALDDHTLACPAEYPSFDEAEMKVHKDLVSLGFLRLPAAPRASAGDGLPDHGRSRTS